MFDKANDSSIRPRYLIYDIMEFEVRTLLIFLLVLYLSVLGQS